MYDQYDVKLYLITSSQIFFAVGWELFCRCYLKTILCDHVSIRLSLFCFTGVQSQTAITLLSACESTQPP